MKAFLFWYEGLPLDQRAVFIEDKRTVDPTEYLRVGINADIGLYLYRLAPEE